MSACQARAVKARGVLLRKTNWGTAPCSQTCAIPHTRRQSTPHDVCECCMQAHAHRLELLGSRVRGRQRRPPQPTELRQVGATARRDQNLATSPCREAAVGKAGGTILTVSLGSGVNIAAGGCGAPGRGRSSMARIHEVMVPFRMTDPRCLARAARARGAVEPPAQSKTMCPWWIWWIRGLKKRLIRGFWWRVDTCMARIGGWWIRAGENW